MIRLVVAFALLLVTFVCSSYTVYLKIKLIRNEGASFWEIFSMILVVIMALASLFFLVAIVVG